MKRIDIIFVRAIYLGGTNDESTAVVEVIRCAMSPEGCPLPFTAFDMVLGKT